MNEASKILFAIAALIAVYYSIEVYCIMNDDDKNVGKEIIKCIALCVICVVLAQILR